MSQAELTPISHTEDETLSPDGLLALQILRQPPVQIRPENRSYYEFQTPYFSEQTLINANGAHVDLAIVCTRDESYNAIGADDDKSFEYRGPAIPAKIFYDSLKSLEAGKVITIQTRGKVINIDRAWGQDCPNTHDVENIVDAEMKWTVSLSEDKQTVVLDVQAEKFKEHVHLSVTKKPIEGE